MPAAAKPGDQPAEGQYGRKPRRARVVQEDGAGEQCAAEHAPADAVSAGGGEQHEPGEQSAEIEHDKPQGAERRCPGDKAYRRGNRIAAGEPERQTLPAVCGDGGDTECGARGGGRTCETGNPVGAAEQPAQPEDRSGRERTAACQRRGDARGAPFTGEPAQQHGQREGTDGFGGGGEHPGEGEGEDAPGEDGQPAERRERSGKCRPEGEGEAVEAGSGEQAGERRTADQAGGEQELCVTAFAVLGSHGDSFLFRDSFAYRIIIPNGKREKSRRK